jgi:Cell morphogenesis N-terminal
MMQPCNRGESDNSARMATRILCTSRALAGQLDVNSLALWYQSVAMLRTAVASWQAKGSKHMVVTLPLQTQLLCLDSDSAFLHGINSLVDTLSKQLRASHSKALMLLCSNIFWRPGCSFATCSACNMVCPAG